MACNCGESSVFVLPLSMIPAVALPAVCITIVAASEERRSKTSTKKNKVKCLNQDSFIGMISCHGISCNLYLQHTTKKQARKVSK